MYRLQHHALEYIVQCYNKTLQYHTYITSIKQEHHLRLASLKSYNYFERKMFIHYSFVIHNSWFMITRWSFCYNPTSVLVGQSHTPLQHLDCPQPCFNKITYCCLKSKQYNNFNSTSKHIGHIDCLVSWSHCHTLNPELHKSIHSSGLSSGCLTSFHTLKAIWYIVFGGLV